MFQTTAYILISCGVSGSLIASLLFIQIKKDIKIEEDEKRMRMLEEVFGMKNAQ